MAQYQHYIPQFLLRNFFHYYQPQPIILQTDWFRHGETWLRLGVLAAVGTLGYALALWTFCKRDLPAPL